MLFQGKYGSKIRKMGLKGIKNLQKKKEKKKLIYLPLSSPLPLPLPPPLPLLGFVALFQEIEAKKERERVTELKKNIEGGWEEEEMGEGEGEGKKEGGGNQKLVREGGLMVNGKRRVLVLLSDVLLLCRGNEKKGSGFYFYIFCLSAFIFIFFIFIFFS